MDDLIYWVALQGIEGIGPATFGLLLKRFNGPRAAFEASRRKLNSVRGISNTIIKKITQARENLNSVQSLLKTLDRNNVNIIIKDKEGYPPLLLEVMKNPPVILYTKGRYLRGDERAVAIVGTTSPTEKGFWIAKESAKRLVKMGFTVVSGYAKGIDTASHLGALEAGGRTILALPMGILQFSWRDEFKHHIKDADKYLLLSDCCPTRGWYVGAAMSRNRLIACLSRAVFVVESEVSGGAIYTAGVAKGLGKKILTSRYKEAPLTARGNQTLLEKGAIPIKNFKELEKCIVNL